MYTFYLKFTDGTTETFYARDFREYKETFWIINTTKGIDYYQIVDNATGKKTIVFVEGATRPI